MGVWGFGVNFQWKGKDLLDWNSVTKSIVEFSQEYDICTGVGTLDLVVKRPCTLDLSPGIPVTIGMWDSFKVSQTLGLDIYGSFNVILIEENIPENTYVITCQDDSIKLVDYFIDQQYEITYPSTSRYWLEKFLTDASVTYEFSEGITDSVPMSENTTLGLTSAYDAVMTLLQMNGWYMYFDSVDEYPWGSICYIGKLNITDEFRGRTIPNRRIIDISTRKSDKFLRNRVVVWGAYNPDTNTTVYADTSTITPWNRNDSDYRTVVYTNTAIKTFAIAYKLAKTILDEFSKTIPEKTINTISDLEDLWNDEEERPSTYLELLGMGYYFKLGNAVKIISSKTGMLFSGVITHITVNGNSEGIVTTFILDQRCPRLFGFVNWNDYVYIGTTEHGVWRKFLTSSTWSDYSTGITDLGIKDLAAYDGFLGCVTQNTAQSFYRHTSSDAWVVHSPEGFYDYSASGYSASGGVFIGSGQVILAEACSIDRTYGVNGLLNMAYTIPNSGGWPLASGTIIPFPASGNLSWVVGLDVEGANIYTQQVHAQSGGMIVSYDIGVIDMDTNLDGHNILSVYNGKTNYGYQIPPYSGGMFDYGGPVTWLGGYSTSFQLPDTEGPASGPVIVAVPETTSGNIVEQTSYDYEDLPFSGGYWYVSAGFIHNGGIILLDDAESDGYGYSFYTDVTASTLWKRRFCLASGIWDGYDWTHWNGTILYRLDTHVPYDTSYKYYFHILDDNLFSVNTIYQNYINTYVYQTPEEPKVAFGRTLQASGILTTHVDASPSDMVYMDTQISNAIYTISKPGRGYVGIIYAKSNLSGGKDYYIGVLNAADGTIEETYITSTINLQYSVPSVYCINYCGVSPHYAYFGLVSVKSDTTSTWQGFTIYAIVINRNTGAVSIGNYSIKPNLPDGDAYLSDWVESTNFPGYRRWFIQPINENPDSGIGFARLFVTVEINISIGINTYYNVTCVDAIITQDGNIETPTVYVDTNYPNGWKNKSPEWMRGYIDEYELGVTPPGELFPTFSRHVTNSPIVIPAYVVGDHTEPRFVNPLDFSDVIGAPQTIETGNQWGIPESYPYFKLLYPMLDDITDLIYGAVTSVGGGEQLTVGYDFSGNIVKILFPIYNDLAQDQIRGQPLENKLVYATETSATVYLFIPTFPVSGMSRIASNYLILDHDPTVASGGKFEIIHQGEAPLMVDTSKGIPTVLYELPFIASSGVEIDSPKMEESFLNEFNSFEHMVPNAPTFDVRTFDISDNLGFPASGWVPSGFLDRFIGVAGGKKGLLMYHTTPFDGIAIPIMPSGLIYSGGSITHLDFTNNDASPYIFFSVSGIVLTATSGRFYQRNNDTPFFVDYTVTLPQSEITIIKADDRM